jgi:PAS domain S-box-containing protein
MRRLLKGLVSMKPFSELTACLENSPACAIVWQTDGSLLYLNGSALQSFEATTLPQVQLQSFYDYVIEADRVPLLALVESVIHGHTGELTLEFRGLQGARQCMKICVSPLQDAGQVVAMLGLAQACPRPRPHLRESDWAMLDLALSMMQTGAVLTDECGRILQVTGEACRLLDCDRAELLALNFTDLHQLECSIPLSECWRALPTRRTHVVESTHPLRDGRTLPIEIKAHYFETNGQGRILALLTDISERQSAAENLVKVETKLRTESELNQLLFDTSPAFIVAIGSDGKTWMMNRALLQALEYTADEVEGIDYLSTFVPLDEQGQLPEIFRQITKEDHPIIHENRIRSKSGRTYLVEWHGRCAAKAVGGMDLFVGIGINITERRQMESALRQSEENYRGIFNATSDAIIIHDLAGGILDVNQRMCEMFGYSRAEALILRVGDLSEGSPAYSQAEADARLSLTAQGKPQVVEWRSRRKNGELFWSEVALQMGWIVGQPRVIASVRDITARKQMAADRVAHLHFFESMDRVNRAIQGANNLEDMLQQVLQATLSIFDCDRVFLMYPCDPQAASWTSPMECTKPAYPGILSTKTTVPMDAEAAESLRLMLASDRPIKFGQGTDHPLPAREYERFGFKCFIAMAIRPRASKPWEFGLQQCSHVRIWTIEEERLFQEIGRRLADGLTSLLFLRDLRENEGKLAEAERVAHLGYWERNFNENRVTISEETRRILGLSHTENTFTLEGWQQYWLQQIHPEDRDRAKETLEQALRSEQPYSVEYRVLNPHGPARTVRSHGEAARDALGKPRRMFGIVQDITEIRQLEERLRQSQKMEAIGQLAGGVAHDFNNILTSVIMQVDLGLGETSLSPELEECLRQIRKDAERAANLTRQLLLFSRRQILQPRELDLNEVVTNLAKMLQRIIGEDVRLQLLLSPVPLMTRADAGMIDQVLLNLAVNARDAMPNGGNLIIETTEKSVDETLAKTMPDASPGQYACLSVSDNGAGISAEILPKIFEPFFTTKEPGKGTGLGLATVFGIVKQHRGWVKVCSENHCGATFQVYLPLISRTQSAHAHNVAQPQPRGGSETLLVVEDETSVRLTTKTILTRYGYHVLLAANGADALELWQKHRTDIALLLTDMVMPGNLSGLQLAQRLQTETPSLKIIFTSGYSPEIAGRQLELHSGNNFLQKPFSPHQLLLMVRSSLDAKRS